MEPWLQDSACHSLLCHRCVLECKECLSPTSPWRPAYYSITKFQSNFSPKCPTSWSWGRFHWFENQTWEFVGVDSVNDHSPPPSQLKQLHTARVAFLLNLSHPLKHDLNPRHFPFLPDQLPLDFFGGFFELIIRHAFYTNRRNKRTKTAVGWFGWYG